MQPACEDPQTLRAFLLGQLCDEDSQRVSMHIEECSMCEETIAGLDDTVDSLIDGVRSATDNENSQLLESALRRITNPFGGAPAEVNSQLPTQMVREYELLEELGRGGMGAVYRARHTKLNRVVALKLLPSRRLRNDAAVQRFEREMMAIGRLRHPSIVQATDAGEVAGTHFLAMELIEGVDASRLVKHHGSLGISAACAIIRQCALALEYAHGEGLIHRDIKPGNIMVSTQRGEGQVKLLDLGLALFGSASEAVDELTTVGQLMGTLDYMAPEQADSSHTVTEAADIYSLGATLYKLLTGTAPYETDAYRTPMQKMKALSLVEPDSVASRRDGLPTELVNLVDRMLSRDVGAGRESSSDERPSEAQSGLPEKGSPPSARHRPDTATEVAEALLPWCQDEAGTAAELSSLVDAAKVTSEDLPQLPATGDVLPEIEKGLESFSGKRVSGPQNALAEKDTRPPVQPPTGGIWKLLAGLVALIIAGVVYRIETDNGTLIIECSSDRIPVQIRSGQEVVASMTLLSGKNRVTLRSGQYEVLMPASFDELKVTNGSVEIHRGEETVARVSEVPNSVKAAGSTDSLAADDGSTGSSHLEATFEGRTFDEWRAVVRTERSLQQLDKAIRAVIALAPGTKHIPDRTRAALETVFEVISQRPVYSGSRHEIDGPIWQTVLESDLGEVNTGALRNYFTQRLSEADLSKSEEHLIARFWASYFQIDEAGESLPVGEIIITPASMTAELDASNSFQKAVAGRFREADEFLQLAWLDSLQRRIDEQKHKITRAERELLADSLGGEFGLLVQQLALQLKRDTLKELDSDLASALMDLIESRGPLLRVQRIYDVNTWAFKLNRWQLLKSLTPVSRSLVPRLQQWAVDDSVVTLVFGVLSNLQRQTLACYLLKELGADAQSSLPLLKKCLKEKYGIELLRDGGNAYQLVSVQIIPDDVTAPAWVIDEASPFVPILKPEEVVKAGHRYALLQAISSITGEPLHVSPGSPAEDQVLGFGAYLVETNGKDFAAYLEEYEAETEWAIAEREVRTSVLFKLACSNGQHEKLNKAIFASAVAVLKRPPVDGVTELFSPNESGAGFAIEAKSYKTMQDFMGGKFGDSPGFWTLMEAAIEQGHAAWRCFALKSLIDQVAVEVTDFNAAGEALKRRVGYTIASSFRVSAEGFSGSLRSLYPKFDELTHYEQDALLTCLRITDEGVVKEEFLAGLLADEDSPWRLRAAIMLVEQDVDLPKTLQRQLREFLIETVADESRPVDMANAGIALLRIPADQFTVDDAKRMLEGCKPSDTIMIDLPPDARELKVANPNGPNRKALVRKALGHFEAQGERQCAVNSAVFFAKRLRGLSADAAQALTDFELWTDATTYTVYKAQDLPMVVALPPVDGLVAGLTISDVQRAQDNTANSIANVILHNLRNLLRPWSESSNRQKGLGATKEVESK